MKYLPQVLLRSGISLAIRTGILYKTRKYFINQKDLGIWEKKTMVLSDVISFPCPRVWISKKQNPFVSFLPLKHSSHSFGALNMVQVFRICL